MLKRVLLSLALILPVFFLSGCSLGKKPAALQITSDPSANVFIDGKPFGKTPYQADNLKAGEVTVKLIPDSSTEALVSWEGKVKLNAGVVTLIDRKLAVSDSSSSGQILSLEKIKDSKSSSISVVTEPDGALVKINNETKGTTPLSLDKMSEGDYSISVAKDGFSEKSIKAKVANGYMLVVNVKLAQIEVAPTITPTPTPTLKPGTKPSPTPKVSVTPKPTSSVANPARPFVEIKETPTGWLRVRVEPSTTATEAAKVNPGEKYPLISEQNGWYKIQYDTGKEGWISGQYATKFQ